MAYGERVQDRAFDNTVHRTNHGIGTAIPALKTDASSGEDIVDDAKALKLERVKK